MEQMSPDELCVVGAVDLTDRRTLDEYILAELFPVNVKQEISVALLENR